MRVNIRLDSLIGKTYLYYGRPEGYDRSDNYSMLIGQITDVYYTNKTRKVKIKMIWWTFDKNEGYEEDIDLSNTFNMSKQEFENHIETQDYEPFDMIEYDKKYYSQTS